MAAIVAAVEIVAVFIAAMLLSRFVQTAPGIQEWRLVWSEPLFIVAVRWLPLVLLAAIIDAALRGRSLIRWGLAGNGSILFQMESGAWLFLLGGTIPLALTVASPPAASLFDGIAGLPGNMAALALAGAIAGPVLAQEVFLTGYANTRLAETWPAILVPFVIAAAFAAAHANHLGAGSYGVAFVAAMALQGWLWSSARFAGVSLVALMAAHGALLIAYEWPREALIVCALTAVALAGRFPRWWAQVERQ